MLLGYEELVEVVKAGFITNIEPHQINGASIDVTLGRYIQTELPRVAKDKPFRVSLASRKPLPMKEHDIHGGKKFILLPGQFILAQTQQVFHLPNYLAAEFEMKSSASRIGLEHLKAGWCDPTWNNSVLTLELKNMTRNCSIELREGDSIGQMKFMKLTSDVPDDRSYAVRGRYNNDEKTQGPRTFFDRKQNC